MTEHNEDLPDDTLPDDTTPEPEDQRVTLDLRRRVLEIVGGQPTVLIVNVHQAGYPLPRVQLHAYHDFEQARQLEARDQGLHVTLVGQLLSSGPRDMAYEYMRLESEVVHQVQQGVVNGWRMCFNMPVFRHHAMTMAEQDTLRDQGHNLIQVHRMMQAVVADHPRLNTPNRPLAVGVWAVLEIVWRAMQGWERYSHGYARLPQAQAGMPLVDYIQQGIHEMVASARLFDVQQVHTKWDHNTGLVNIAYTPFGCTKPEIDLYVSTAPNLSRLLIVMEGASHFRTLAPHVFTEYTEKE